MTRPMAVAVLCVFGLVVAACSGAVTPTTTPAVAPDGASFLILYVSNQSFDDDPVGILVEIDDVIVVDDEFSADGQPFGIEFDIQLGTGAHIIEAVSSTGASYRTEIAMADTTRWAVLDYRVFPGADPRQFTLQIQDFPF